MPISYNGSHARGKHNCRGIETRFIRKKRVMSVDARIAELGLILPKPPQPVAAYIPAVRTGNLLIVSGQLPMTGGQLLAQGPVPSCVPVDQAQQAAAQCVLNALAIARAELNGQLDQITRVVRIGVFVQSDPRFGEQPKVANGASELLVRIFGEVGKHARAAVGVPALPLDASVEVEFVFEIRD